MTGPRRKIAVVKDLTPASAERDFRSLAPKAPEYVTQEDFDKLRADVLGLAELTHDILTGFKEKIGPRIDSLEAYLGPKGPLTEDITASFAKQSETVKVYIDQKLGGAGAAAPGQPSRGGMDGLIDFARDQIDKAGGIQKLIQGFTGEGSGGSLSEELGILEKAVVERQRALVRNALRRTLNLPEAPIPEVAAEVLTAIGVTAP